MSKNEASFRKNNIAALLINIGCILSLIIVIFPLLLVAKYDYPSADDWSYGVNAYKALKSGGGFFDVLLAAVQRAKEAYLGWDGRFANSFLDSLQPGIWGEKYYAITPWLLISMLIVSELLFFRNMICFGVKSRVNSLLWIPIVIPMLIIQILFTPSPVESFYWYTGGMNYTFMYGLSLVLMVLFIRLGTTQFCAKRQRFFLGMTAWILSVFVGGGNFSTSLSTILALCIITLSFLLKRKYSFLQRTWFIPLTAAACLAICLLSPGSIKGNSIRMTQMKNPLYAICQSLAISADNIRIWTLTGAVLLMLLFTIPFMWKAVDAVDISFRCPLLFSLLTFGVYASQTTPNIYVIGGIGGQRVTAILYYGCMLWDVINVFYWIGWLKTKIKAGKSFSNVNKRNIIFSSALLILYCIIISLFMMSFIYVFNKKNISAYKAYRDWRQGLAQQYADEWENRLEILHDENINEVIFLPLQYYPQTLLYIELQWNDSDVNYWVNDACALYYDKDCIQMTAPEEYDSK